MTMLEKQPLDFPGLLKSAYATSCQIYPFCKPLIYCRTFSEPILCQSNICLIGFSYLGAISQSFSFVSLTG